jgi:hypothetical protein
VAKISKQGDIIVLDGVVRIEETIPQFRDEPVEGGKKGETQRVEFTEWRVYSLTDVSDDDETTEDERWDLRGTYATQEEAMAGASDLFEETE